MNIIEKEKARQEYLIKTLNGNIRSMKQYYRDLSKRRKALSGLSRDYFLAEYYKLKYESAPNFKIEGLYAGIEQHKESLINLKEYMEDELSTWECIKSISYCPEKFSEKVESMKKEIKELTKLIEAYK